MRNSFTGMLGLGVMALASMLPMTAHAKHHSSCSSTTGSHEPVQGFWQALTNPGEFGPNTDFPACGFQLLLTDGTIMVFNQSFPDEGEVWKLTPDVFGSYVNGTWSQLATLPSGYMPTAYASVVLADGRVIVQGGELNGPLYPIEFTDMGAIYDPVTNAWTMLPPPPFFNGTVGDAQSVILPDGTYMVANAVTRQAALLDLNTLTWTETGTSTKWDTNDEENWTLLPNGKVLAVDATGVNAPDAIITTNISGVGPFFAKPANGPFVNNNFPIDSIVGPAAVSSDDTACSQPDDLTDTIGVCYRSEFCGSGTIVSNMFKANAIAVIEIANKPVPSVSGGGNGKPFSCMISPEDGAALVAAINSYPNLEVTITQPPAEVRFNYTELYNPKTGTWGPAGDGNTVVALWDPATQEMGPAVLRPDGTVFCTGVFPGNTAIYDSCKNSWSKGPTFPYVPGEGQLNCNDTGAALLPNGNVLASAFSAPNPPMHFFEFDGKELIEQPAPPNADNMFDGAFMLVLPTGQIMVTDVFTTDVEFYTSGNTSFNPDWAPVISHVSKKVRPGNTYKIEGIRFNGMSQGAMYGDDYQSATNYPLVRITSKDTGLVFYCRTHDHSYMGVASDRKVHTYFDVSDNVPSGKYKLEVVANGIPSKPVTVQVKG